MVLARGPPSDPSPFSPGERGNDGSGGISGPTTPNDAGAGDDQKKGRDASERPAAKRAKGNRSWGIRTKRRKAVKPRRQAQALAPETQPPNRNEAARSHAATSPQPPCGRRRQRHVSRLCYTSRVSSQSRTRVKLNRVFFPRRSFQARSLGCGFAR